MVHSLPPMNSLRVFASVGQHNSVAKAASDLCVTPGAVSRHVKILEEFLSIQLFKRSGRNILLTNQGQAYWKQVNDLLGRLEVETNRTLNIGTSGPRTVCCSRMFMRNWLLPRLGSFYQKYPEIELNFVISPARGALDPSAHLAIRLGDGNWPNLSKTFLFNSDPEPVCSPEYLAQSPKLACISDLRNHTLVHSSHTPESDLYWKLWLGAEADSVLNEAKNINFDGNGFEYHAALVGLGIGIAQLPLISYDLKKGHLITPLTKSNVSREAYYLVCFEAMRNDPKILEFKRWITSEIGAWLIEPVA
jgi:LysR family glycine cleavage system transcriptional activator